MFFPNKFAIWILLLLKRIFYYIQNPASEPFADLDLKKKNHLFSNHQTEDFPCNHGNFTQQWPELWSQTA